MPGCKDAESGEELGASDPKKLEALDGSVDVCKEKEESNGLDCRPFEEAIGLSLKNKLCTSMLVEMKLNGKDE